MTPSIIFIVPYRDREPQLNVFKIMMKYLMEDIPEDSYEICIAHQMDGRPFNRGAIKNLGFIAMRDKYPNDYKNISFVFHDVDTFPCFKNLINYKTNSGVIKHFYGFRHTLGGIVSINGADFEKMNGFPCYWSYGYEDNVLQNRAIKCGLRIDRSIFFAIGNPQIFQSVDHFVKSINRNWKQIMNQDNGVDGISTIKNIKYTEENDFINFTTFDTLQIANQVDYARVNLITNKYIDGNINQRFKLNIDETRYNTNPRQPTNSTPEAQMAITQGRARFMRRGGFNFINR